SCPDCFAEMRACGGPVRAKQMWPLPSDTIVWFKWYYLNSRMSLSGNNHLPGLAAGLLVRIDPHASEGLQQQVYAAVRRAILDGVLTPGTQLPSSRALAEDLRISRTTTLLAYERLLAEGYLAARHGSGTFVAEELPDDLPQRIAPRRLVRTRHPKLSR